MQSFFAFAFLTQAASSHLRRNGAAHVRFYADREGNITENSALSHESTAPVDPSDFEPDTDGNCMGTLRCIKVSVLPKDYCQVTGQANWCAAYVGGPACVMMVNYEKYIDDKCDSKKNCLKVECAGTKTACKSSDTSGLCNKPSTSGTYTCPKCAVNAKTKKEPTSWGSTTGDVESDTLGKGCFLGGTGNWMGCGCKKPCTKNVTSSGAVIHVCADKDDDGNGEMTDGTGDFCDDAGATAICKAHGTQSNNKCDEWKAWRVTSTTSTTTASTCVPSKTRDCDTDDNSWTVENN